MGPLHPNLGQMALYVYKARRPPPATLVRSGLTPQTQRENTEEEDVLQRLWLVAGEPGKKDKTEAEKTQKRRRRRRRSNQRRRKAC